MRSDSANPQAYQLFNLARWIRGHGVALCEVTRGGVRVSSHCTQLDADGIARPCCSMPEIVRTVAQANRWLGY
jgi:hypothetical protein